MNVPNKLVQKLNMFLRDNEKLNKLIEGKEHSPAQLRDALIDSLDDWNITPPPLTPVDFSTHPSRRLLIHGAVIELLQSAGILQSRNRLQYNDGGITVSVSDKASDYQSWISLLVNDYERKKRAVKVTKNVELGWGGVSSEYSKINATTYEELY